MKNIANNLTSGAQGYYPRAIAKVVDQIMNQKQQQQQPETTTFTYLDPKQQTKSDYHYKPDAEGFSEATVFVVGGGNFFEYQNVTQLMAQPENKGKQVIYGCTDIITGVEFAEELALLGTK